MTVGSDDLGISASRCDEDSPRLGPLSSPLNLSTRGGLALEVGSAGPDTVRAVIPPIPFCRLPACHYIVTSPRPLSAWISLSADEAYNKRARTRNRWRCVFPGVRRLRQRTRRADQARNGMTSCPESNGRPTEASVSRIRVRPIRRYHPTQPDPRPDAVRGAHLRRLMPRDSAARARTHARIDPISTR